MKGSICVAGLLATVIGLTIAAHGFNYLYLSDAEMSVFGDRIRLPMDTLDGPVRSNDELRCFGLTVFTDLFITSTDGPGCESAIFRGPPPIYGATEILIPSRADFIRAMAVTQGNLFGDPDTMMMVNLRDTLAVLWSWPLGTLMDSSESRTLATTGGEQMFWWFESPIRIRGVLRGNLVIGCAHSIGIEDNVLYVDADSLTGRTPLSSGNYLTLAAEGEIKIRNTIENGRENSNELGGAQTDPAFTSVVITANMFALGESFTFENQNDPDSGYVCECAPDERGSIWIYGGLTQKRRGYYHRSNLGGTGYQMHMRFDPRIRDLPNLVVDAPPLQRYPDTLDFEEVLVNETVRDTVTISCDYSISVFGAHATAPFYSSGAIPPVWGDTVRVPVQFTPNRLQSYDGILTIYADFGTPVITLLGRGVERLDAREARGARTLSLEVFPNPFNQTSEISLQFPGGASGQLTVFDLLGREVRRWDVEEGEQVVRFEAGDLATGVYLAVLEAGDARVVKKVMLLK